MTTFSKLKPFDSAIQAGTKLTLQLDNNPWHLNTVYIGQTSAGCVVSETSSGTVIISLKEDVRTAPLFWIDDNPVYPSQMVYTTGGYALVVAKYDAQTNVATFSNSAVALHVSKLSYNKPTQKKNGWVNIYKTAEGDTVLSGVHPSKEEALACCCTYRYYVTTISIEWEE